MKFFHIISLSITIFSSLNAMQAPETIQANDEAACNWATQLCTESFLEKARSNSSKVALKDAEDEIWSLFSNLRFDTQGLDEEENKLLAQLVEHNEWSKQLYKKIQSLTFDFDHYWIKNIYTQIIHWAFGRTSLGFNKVPRFAWKKSQTNFSLEDLPQFMVEHINLYRKNGKPFVFKMLKTPDVKLVSKLIEIGANPNARCARNGNSALHELSYVRYWDHKPYFQVKDETAQQYYREFIALLTEYIDINVRNDLGQTPLHSAVGNMNFMKVLLAGEKVQIDAQDKDGNTALHQAAYCFDPEKYSWDNPLRRVHNIHIERKNDKFGTLLLLYGANPEIRNNAGLCYNDIIDKKREEFKQQQERARNNLRHRHLWSDYPCY